MRISCPDPLDLQEALTPISGVANEAPIDEHLRDCSSCRDHLRDLRRVDALLLHSVGTMPDDFEQTFTDGVLDRMVTSQERRGPINRRLTLSSAIAVCAVACCLAMFAFRPEPSPAPMLESAENGQTFSRFEDMQEQRLRQRDAMDASLLATAEHSSSPTFSSDLLHSLHGRYRREGRSLDGAIVRLLSTGVRGPVRARLLRSIGGDGERALLYLRRESQRSTLSTGDRELIACAAVRIGTQRAYRVVEQQLRYDVSLDIVLEAMANASASPEQVHFLQWAIGGSVQCDSALMATCLSRLTSAEVPDLLWGLLKRNPQARSVVAVATAHPRLIDVVRRVAFSLHGNDADRRTAIELLGQVQDKESTAALGHLLEDRIHRLDAVKALERIGSSEAVVVLAENLDVSGRGEAASSKLNTVLIQSLRRLGDSAAGFLLSQVQLGKAGDPRQFLLAAGVAGDDRHIPLLGEFLSRDDLKTTVVQAMAIMTCERAEGALRDLLHLGDRRVVREVRRVLKQRHRLNKLPPRRLIVQVNPHQIHQPCLIVT